METVTVRVDTLQRIIKDLQNAVQVCYDVDSLSEDDVHSYPYATGYSRSAMTYAIEDLNKFLNK